MDKYNISPGFEYSSISQYSAIPYLTNNPFSRQPYDYVTARSVLAESEHSRETEARPTTVSYQVFGRQIRHSKLSIHRLNQLLYERCKLHYKHVKEINSRHMKFQEDLFCMKINSPGGDSRRWASLEQMLAQLEGEKRREDLVCWKDTVELRNTVFEKSLEYDDSKERANILGDLFIDGSGDQNE